MVKFKSRGYRFNIRRIALAATTVLFPFELQAGRLIVMIIGSFVPEQESWNIQRGA